MIVDIKLGPWTFDHASYDRDADVLYLSIGPPRRTVGEETPEGHVALYDESTGEFCGLTLIGFWAQTDENGYANITVPSPPQEIPVETANLKRLVTA